ncbi:MAG: hypothetical protein QM392_04440 [Bacillota bacterium]|jgi:hypothetical protein|nr:hypothetical protein [Bacillota bacterium]
MIGTRNEGSLHGGLKEYYRRPGARVEAEVDGYIIDLVQGDCLLEIQTGNFSALKPKLRSLLPNYRLHVVFPIPLERYLVYVDQTTGEVLTRRRSPKKGTIYDLFGELIRIPQFLPHPNLTVEAVYIVEEEIRCDDGRGSWRRRGVSIVDRRLCAVTGKQVFGSAGDYLSVLPSDLPEPFTNKQLADMARISEQAARKVTYTLRKAGWLLEAGRQGNSILHQVG